MNQLLQHHEAKLQQALDNCAKEPIHIPGSIQPHGYLIVADYDFHIVKASANFLEFSGQSTQQLVGKSLQRFIPADSIASLKNLTGNGALNALRYQTILLNGPTEQLTCDAMIHRSGQYLIIEIEPQHLIDKLPQHQDFYRELMGFSLALQKVESEDVLFNYVVHELRRITGFARVKLYKFDEHWHGDVIAEDKDARMTSYLGLSFPASDIPEQARELYSKNYLRLIPNVDFTPVPMLPDDLDEKSKPIDLSFSILRSVSMVHLQYLKNMNVRASMSISVMQNGQLWGLIVCHHDAPYHVAYPVRMAAELLANTFSAFLTNYQQLTSNSKENQREKVFNEIVQAVNSAATAREALVTHSNQVMNLASADGLAMSFDDEWINFGFTPDESATRQLAAWVQQSNNGERVFSSHSLAKTTGLKTFRESGVAGAIVAPVSHQTKNWLMFFRRQVTMERNWAGEPVKEISSTRAGYTLSPRASFQRWAEVVTGHCKPWNTLDVERISELSRLIRTRLYENSLRQANYNLDAVLRHSSSLIYIIDINGILVQINQIAVETFGLGDGEIIGRPFEKIFPESLSSLTREHIDTVMQCGKSTSFDDHFTVNDTELHLISVVFPLFDTKNAVYALCNISTDISGLHKAQQELKASNKELERVAFVASHDLQEPLRLIATFTDLLKSEYKNKLDSQAGEYIDFTLDAANRMRVLIHDLLEYSRLEQSDETLPLIETGDELNKLLAELHLSGHLENASVSVTSEMPEAYMKAEHFNSIMQNLLSNAAKYRDADRPVDIAIACRDQGAYWQFSVSDNGIGIKPEYLEKIFEMFQRLHRKNEFAGTGIGLALCKKIAERHGGKIWAESIPGEGSTFHFTVIKTDMAQQNAEKISPATESSVA
ncbi:MAG: ATP-binding protein [Granulosicoccus sp.]